jgi:predicted RNA-binding Zn-ribbon protein involved in translation (DUF1610 family)
MNLVSEAPALLRTKSATIEWIRKMQTFICPQCGCRSTYDPWVESAHCLDCGYKPTGKEWLQKANEISSSQDLDRFVSDIDRLTDKDRIRPDIIAQIYNGTKDIVSGYIIMVRMDDHLYTFDEDAQKLIELCGADLQVEEDFIGVASPTACFLFNDREAFMQRVQDTGYKIGMAQAGVLTCPQCGQVNRIRDIFHLSYQCFQCGYNHPE